MLLTCSIHATEIASTHTAVEYAYRLLTEDSPHNRAILKDTILLLVPSLNPDGVDIVTRWYRKTLGTPYEGSSPPELYQKYVGHDNNRDWYIFSQPETRLTISKLHNVWHPEIVYDVHQQARQRQPHVRAAMARPGGAEHRSDPDAGDEHVRHHDGDGPDRGRQDRRCHSRGLRFLVALAALPGVPRRTAAADRIGQRADRVAHQTDAQTRSRRRRWATIRASGRGTIWSRGWAATWRLRDIVDYQLIAFDSVLYNAALHRDELLRNFYKVAERQVARNQPWGFVISADQRDPGATRKMLETLRFGQVEIGRGADGSAVIPMHQPYSGWAKSAAGAPALSRRPAVPRWSAEAAVRRDGAHAAAADGRGGEGGGCRSAVLGRMAGARSQDRARSCRRRTPIRGWL